MFKELFEGKKARIATGVAGGTLGVVGLANAKHAEFNQDIDDMVKRKITNDPYYKASKIVGGDYADKIDSKFEASKIGHKIAKEIGYTGAGLGATLLGGAIVKAILAKKKENVKIKD